MKARLIPIMAAISAIAIPTAAMAESTPVENAPVVVPDSPLAANDSTAGETVVDLKVDNAGKDIESSEKADDEDKGWGIGATVGFDLGLGAFTKHEYAKKIRSTFSFEISGYYTIPVIDVNINLKTGFTQWMSEAGGSNGKHEFRWADSTVGFSRPIWEYKSGEFGVGFGIALDFTLPTSTATINAKRYIAVVPSLSASFSLSRLTLSYAISYGYNAHKYTSPTFDPSEVDVISRSAGNELINSGNIAIGGVLVEHELTNVLALNIECITKHMLDLNIALGFYDGWSYDNGTITKDDEFVSPNAKVGRGHSQITQGVISLAYTPIRYATVALSVISTQPSKTADNKTIRFPWFDTISPSKNYTKFMISGSFRY